MGNEVWETPNFLSSQHGERETPALVQHGWTLKDAVPNETSQPHKKQSCVWQLTLQSQHSGGALCEFEKATGDKIIKKKIRGTASQKKRPEGR